MSFLYLQQSVNSIQTQLLAWYNLSHLGNKSMIEKKLNDIKLHLAQWEQVVQQKSVNGCFMTLILFYVFHNDSDG